MSKYSDVLIACTNVRVNSLLSATISAVGMCFGSVLIA